MSHGVQYKAPRKWVLTLLADEWPAHLGMHVSKRRPEQRTVVTVVREDERRCGLGLLGSEQESNPCRWGYRAGTVALTRKALTCIQDVDAEPKLHYSMMGRKRLMQQSLVQHCEPHIEGRVNCILGGGQTVSRGHDLAREGS